MDPIEQAHNTGAPMSSVMQTKAARAWEKSFEKGRGVGLILSQQRRGNYALARWDWRRGDESERGWLAVRFAEDGRVDRWWFTEKAPPQRWASAAVGQSADVATTTAALASGFVEANPIVDAMGLPVAAAIKIGGTYWLEQSGNMNACYSMTPIVNQFGWGAAAFNLGVMAGAGQGAIIPAIAIIAATSKYDPFWQCLPKELR